ncbi:uncharacterized protein MELLADRAFT_102064 [Melampsora larici-populina 98AG31]|uniref:Uncharacterized protein n=1 Tax=Melampsora larici-populina (strain 98AG31 / pathotype 3-4-7) TaxID=747676 RepID=F4R5W3_MELLP|nr:uncharacterized protein MELLADRAFT_102064 [Melampsora larici-populina 98AG31]EGG12184.1 hypothetical protein MELLADRAFT_102064 [Melampsora larici-populina 98AG31]
MSQSVSPEEPEVYESDLKQQEIDETPKDERFNKSLNRFERSLESVEEQIVHLIVAREPQVQFEPKLELITHGLADVMKVMRIMEDMIKPFETQKSDGGIDWGIVQSKIKRHTMIFQNLIAACGTGEPRIIADELN